MCGINVCALDLEWQLSHETKKGHFSICVYEHNDRRNNFK